MEVAFAVESVFWSPSSLLDALVELGCVEGGRAAVDENESSRLNSACLPAVVRSKLRHEMRSTKSKERDDNIITSVASPLAR